jgi:deoxyribose-phosphate aldolase
MNMPGNQNNGRSRRSRVGWLRHDERSVAVPRDYQGRPVLSLDALAGLIDYRLHVLTDLDEVLAGAVQARQWGVAAVTCRPEHVAPVAAELAGSDLGVVSAVEFHDAPRLPLRPAALVEEGLRLAEAGATDVGLIADPARALPVEAGRQHAHSPPAGAPTGAGAAVLHGFTDLVAALTEGLQPFGTRVRAHIDVTSMTAEQAAHAAQAAHRAGASMVQVGTWRHDFASFPAVQATRRVLGPSVALKWTTPVRSLAMLLFAFGEGVDRFNVDDIGRLLTEARKSAMAGPLLAPVEGLDY